MAYRPKHFKIHCSIKNHRKTAELFADNDLIAMYVRLGILAIERFADRYDGKFTVHDRELLEISGKRRADVARTSLERLADVSPMSASRDGDLWTITIPNLRKKQGFQSEAVPKRSTSPTPTPTPTPTPKKKESSPAANGSVDRWAWDSAVKIPKPDIFEGEVKDRIYRWADERGHSRRLLNDALEIWEEWTEPVKGPKTRTPKSWAGSFQRMLRKSLEENRLLAETDEEKYHRKLAVSQLSILNGGIAE